MFIRAIQFLSLALTVGAASLQPLSAHAQTAASGTIITIAGNGIGGGPAGDGGPATDAALTGPVGLAIGPDSTLYFYDLHDAITTGSFRAINPSNGIISTRVASVSSEGLGLGVDFSRHRLYFADFDDDLVLQINLANNAVNPFAGVGQTYPYPIGSGERGDGGPAGAAWLYPSPYAVAVDGAGNVFIAEGARIRKVNASTQIIMTICGLPDPVTGGFSDIAASTGDGGPSTNATLTFPVRMSVDRAGDVFMLDLQEGSDAPCYIRRIEASTGIIDTIAGKGTNSPVTAGPAASMGLTNLQAIAVNEAGTELFVGGITRVYRVDLTTGILSPYAGNGTNGFSGDGGPALNAEFHEYGVQGLAVSPGGGLLISDYGNLRIRYVVPDSITLTNAPGLTEFHLPWVNSLDGDLLISDNTNLTVVDLGSLTNVAGSVVIDASSNSVGGVLDLGSLTTVVGSVTINAGDSNSVNGSLDLGSLTMVGGSVVINAADSVSADGSLDLGSLTTVGGSVVISAGGTNTTDGTLDLGALTTVGGSVTITNAGTEVINAGSLTTVSGDLDISGNSSTTNIDLGSLTNVCGDITIVSNAPDATVDLNSLADLGGCGTNTVSMAVDGSVLATNGLTIETNTTLAGTATVDGSVTNRGTISPGSSPGHLSFKRNLVLKPNSRLRMEIGGYATNEFDSVSVAGTLMLDGNLSVSLIGSFPNTMTNGASFALMTSANPIIGAFANVASGGQLTTTDGRVRFTVVYAGQTSVTLTDLLILDGDGDGASDADELAAGTDPHNASSVFRLLDIRREGDGVRITWSTVGGKSYIVQTNSGDLAAGFADFSSAIAISGSGESTTNLLHAGAITNSAARLYRVRLGP